MLYKEFINGLNCYLELYGKGLKKQANKEIENMVICLKGCDDDEVDSILFRFLTEYCDKEKWSAIENRGNADIPFSLKEFIRTWLTSRCEKKSMPELRWYYEMFYNDRIGYKYATRYLEEAYHSEKCDQKTVDMLFYSYVDILAWGAHHFPDECIIEQSVQDNAVENCESIMKEKSVSEYLVQQFYYYKALYICYAKYEEGGKVGDFEEYCKDNELVFHYNKAYYYEK